LKYAATLYAYQKTNQFSYGANTPGIRKISARSPARCRKPFEGTKTFSRLKIVRSPLDNSYVLMNTHTHGDYVSGNVEFPASVDIIVRENTKL
jgi:hypothetical protein